jgi:hypothetical protein
MRHDDVETEAYKGYTIRIVQDTDPQDPRDWDNLGTMVCFHNRYTLGDKTDLRSGDFNGWDELYNYLVKECDACIILPLYLYDHSGITMSCGNSYPYNDRWDAGQVGFIYISHEKIRKEYSVKRITKTLKDRVTKYLEGEVKTYDDYLRGDVYGFIVEDEEEENIESVWGFFGYPEGKDEAMSEAKAIVDNLEERWVEKLMDIKAIEIKKEEVKC